MPVETKHDIKQDIKFIDASTSLHLSKGVYLNHRKTSTTYLTKLCQVSLDLREQTYALSVGAIVQKLVTALKIQVINF